MGAGSYVPFSQDPWLWFGSLIMPWFVLAAAFAAFYARLVRGSMIEVMSEDYIRTARAKGLRERRVIFRHGLRSAITPVVTAAGLDIGILLGGTILVETVFNIPGVGRLAYDSIQNADLPMIQGTVLLGAFFIIMANLVVDIALRLPRSAGALLDGRRCSSRGPARAVRHRGRRREGRATASRSPSSPGEMLGVVGESGSGKSVSMLTVMGLTRARERDHLRLGQLRGARPARDAPTRSCARSGATTSR